MGPYRKIGGKRYGTIVVFRTKEGAKKIASGARKSGDYKSVRVVKKAGVYYIMGR